MRTSLTPVLAWLAALSGACSSSGGGEECQVDSDCPPGRYCLASSHTCEFDCTFDSDCPDGYECSGRGRCEPEQCEPTNGGVEACDGVDNDCDGASDEEIAPRACERQNQHGACPGSERCAAGAWVCDAPEPAPELCDGLDQDCDQLIDEGFFLGQPCDGVGECGAGILECAGTQGTRCSTEPGGSGHQDTPEVCDALDNDCDGATDEGAPPLPDCELGEQAHDGLDNNCNGLPDEPGGCMVRSPFADVYIDQYEAVVFEGRDCRGVRYGLALDDYPADWPDWDQATTRKLFACSLPGLRPSRLITFYQARRACEDAGKRLCTKEEWSVVCGGSLYWNFPYGQTYSATACNTFSAGFGDTVAGGALPGCVSEQGAYDMSGSLWEWVDSDCDTGDGRKSVQGGAYLCQLEDPDTHVWVDCDLANPAHAEEIAERNGCQYPMDRGFCDWPGWATEVHGFRCCLDAP